MNAACWVSPGPSTRRIYLSNASRETIVSVRCSWEPEHERIGEIDGLGDGCFRPGDLSFLARGPTDDLSITFTNLQGVRVVIDLPLRQEVCCIRDFHWLERV